MSEKSYIGAVGVPITVDMQQDISDATVMRFDIKNKTGTKSWTPSLYGANHLRYITTSTDDFDVAGIYYLHPYIEVGSFKGFCETVSFEVFALWK